MPTKKSLLTALVAFYFAGALLNVIGMIVFQATINNSVYTGRLWYYAFVYIILLAMFGLCFATDALERYRLPITAFAAIAFVYGTSDLDSSIGTARSTIDGPLAGMILKSIGLFLVIFPLIAIIFIIGSEKDSYLGKVWGQQLDSQINLDPTGTLGNISEAVQQNFAPQTTTTNENRSPLARDPSVGVDPSLLHRTPTQTRAPVAPIDEPVVIVAVEKQ